MKYQLKTRKQKEIDVIIDESAKEDFMKMMEWDEFDFNFYTETIIPIDACYHQLDEDEEPKEW